MKKRGRQVLNTRILTDPRSMSRLLYATLVMTLVILVMLLRTHDDQLQGVRLVKAQLVPSMVSKTSFAKLNFAHSADQSPIIPHILHQVYNSSQVPLRYRAWVMAWRRLHPYWQYWFWDLEHVRLLLRRHFPKHVAMFEEYPSDAHRLQAARYFILYAYGGVFMDVEVEPLHPLHNWTYNYQCVFTQETEEHMYIIRRQNDPNLVNSVLLCRPKHPVFMRAIQLLPDYAVKFSPEEYLHSTGQWLLQEAFTQHTRQTAHVQGWQRLSDVTVVPCKYFLPTFNVGQMSILTRKCGRLHVWQLLPMGQLLCRTLQANSFRNLVANESYTNYHWPHKTGWLLSAPQQTFTVWDTVPGLHNISASLL